MVRKQWLHEFFCRSILRKFAGGLHHIGYIVGQANLSQQWRCASSAHLVAFAEICNKLQHNLCIRLRACRTHELLRRIESPNPVLVVDQSVHSRVPCRFCTRDTQLSHAIFSLAT